VFLIIDSIKKIYLYIRAIPKSIWFNFRYLEFRQALKVPMIISHRVKLKKTKGKISILSDNISKGMIRIGFGDVGIFDRKKSRTIWKVEGNVEFHGRCFLGHGSKISVGKKGRLILGNNFKISAESSIVCEKEVRFGENCLLSWDVLIMDSDFHKIKDINGAVINTDEPIIFENNIWVGCRCLILKGTKIESNSVIAANTTMTKSFQGENQIIGGNPPKVIKRNIIWED